MINPLRWPPLCGQLIHGLGGSVSGRNARTLLVLGCLAIIVAAWGIQTRSRQQSSRTARIAAELPALEQPEQRIVRRAAVVAKDAPPRAAGPTKAAVEQDAFVRGVRGATVQLTAEERELLTRYGAEGLGTAIAEADRALALADPAVRAETAEADRRYLLLLNLAAKLAPPPTAAEPAALERQRDYLAQRAREAAALSQLPEAQREQRLADFKDRFFAPENAALNARILGGTNDTP
jgi:hypothetical protein